MHTPSSTSRSASRQKTSASPRYPPLNHPSDAPVPHPFTNARLRSAPFFSPPFALEGQLGCNAWRGMTVTRKRRKAVRLHLRETTVTSPLISSPLCSAFNKSWRDLSNLSPPFRPTEKRVLASFPIPFSPIQNVIYESTVCRTSQPKTQSTTLSIQVVDWPSMLVSTRRKTSLLDEEEKTAPRQKSGNPPRPKAGHTQWVSQGQKTQRFTDFPESQTSPHLHTLQRHPPH